MKRKTILFAFMGLLAVSVVFAAGRRGPGDGSRRQNIACPQAVCPNPVPVCADTAAAVCPLTGAQRACANGTAPAVCPTGCAKACVKTGNRACGVSACGAQRQQQQGCDRRRGGGRGHCRR